MLAHGPFLHTFYLKASLSCVISTKLHKREVDQRGELFMERKQFLATGMLAVLLMGISAAALAGTAEQENQEAGFVTKAFQNLCGQEPDPASLSYYSNVLEEKRLSTK